MGNYGTSKPWEVAQAPSSALKRLMAMSPEEKRLRWINFMRGYGFTEGQISTLWEENQRKVSELLAHLARQGIRVVAKDGQIVGEGL